MIKFTVYGGVSLIFFQEVEKDSLRPRLGHPQQQSALNELCEEASDRHTRTMDAIEDYSKTLRVRRSL